MKKIRSELPHEISRIIQMLEHLIEEHEEEFSDICPSSFKTLKTSFQNYLKSRE